MLVSDSTSSRLWSRWRAHATIVEVKSPFSYVVECDGTKHHVPVNKLRHYNVRCEEVNCDALLLVEPGFDVCCVPAVNVNACTSVIYDRDKDFRNVDYVETGNSIKTEVLSPGQKIEPSELSHLVELQRRQLLKVLDRYPEVFSDTPGLWYMFEMEINVTSDFKPKRLKSYAIPEKLRP
jgi:hypothetical protein